MGFLDKEIKSRKSNIFPTQSNLNTLYLILKLQSLVKLPVPMIFPDFQIGESLLLNLGHDLSDFLDPVLPLLALPQQVSVHQVNHLGDDLLVVSS